ncbi:transcriptional regulator, TetR family [Tistlia consotensis]|uniref:Transcriptional regulator, TetR family n=1 Tax=Tistlia consotensis USBA 355 TaxID=560819 RepID=A0A1Y6BJ12_9PROT|nr:TetR/AcrR family transcriptional regulator [Tistlia consotensis]SMF12877.1 transcriptional regulator, TetR family [Tistlia consotensis USBA 355]SNR50852.1 transcriptional regulator, TetR family [Tistlia consotensis]
MESVTKDGPARSVEEAKSGEASARRGRLAAGEDPAKRAQILAGAERVFNSVGFDAASMNDITREAGVSKATVYVYFSSKEELFAELAEAQRCQHRDELLAAFENHPDVESALLHLGKVMLRKVTSDWAISAQRIVIGVTNRMPEIGRRFYEGGPKIAQQRLAEFLRRKSESGELDVPDPEVAARQLLDLCVSGLMRRRLYAVESEPPSDEQIARYVGAGVEVFMKAYGPKR